MARPKRVAGEKTAYERMEDAFWEMLAEMPYHKMTGKELRERAGVSHNTFYYYFSDMDDMARKLFDGLNIAQGPIAAFAALQQGKDPASVAATIPDFRERYRKVCLLAGSGSPMLVGMLRNAALTAWLDAVGLDEAELTTEDRIDLEFAFGGGIAVFASGMVDDPKAFMGFPDREIGRGVLTKFQELARR